MNDKTEALKLAQMDGEWYLSEDGDEWHVMACSAAEYMSNNRIENLDAIEVLYYEPI